MAGTLERAQIAAEALTWLGTPYKRRASVKGAGADCLGLVRGVWRALVGPEPETAPLTSDGWADQAGAELLLEEARRHLIERGRGSRLLGQVLLFRWLPGLPAKHFAIVTSTGPHLGIVHAYQNHSVREDVMPQSWQERIAAVFDFPGVD